MRVSSTRAVVIKGERTDAFSLAYLVLKSGEFDTVDYENVTRDMVSLANRIIDGHIKKENKKEKRAHLNNILFFVLGAIFTYIISLIF